MDEKQVDVAVDEEWDDAAPRPKALIESLRSFGYSPETALADLVDNSISADARRIDVRFVWRGADSHVAIIDDGRGMSADGLVDAMRPGTVSPLELRRPSDLGRFGLGLKTASFSQARELTVITKPGAGVVSVRRWDLDVVGSTGEWRLLRTAAVHAAQYVELIEKQGGTAIIWTKCDRLIGDSLGDLDRSHDRFLRSAESVSKHLGMIFHRFLDRRSPIVITINGNAVIPWDPILKHSATHQVSPPERLPLAGSAVTISSFVLPHRSKLNDAQQAYGGGTKGWNAHQGFYVYRNDRLVVSGDWLGLGVSKDEHTKLARILVDFDSTLDLLWQIDVKKSTARPPGPIIQDLKRIAAATRRHAESVYRHRGSMTVRSSGKDLVFAWQEFKDRAGALKLRLNRQHPVLQHALDGPPQQRRAVERVLRFAEETIPTTLIGMRVSESLDQQSLPFKHHQTELLALLRYSVETLVKAGQTTEESIRQLSAVEPFASHPQLIEAFKEQLS
ncbi:ATP-binding protein [Micromonospora sp. NPDC000089]|uniref:ATP-binding protein n=1 Tax=unclassified Micromonospora TaxID=2617518 RepID=UPI003692F8D0